MSVTFYSFIFLRPCVINKWAQGYSHLLGMYSNHEKIDGAANGERCGVDFDLGGQVEPLLLVLCFTIISADLQSSSIAIEPDRNQICI